MRIRGALAWFAVLGASAVACIATPDLAYLEGGPLSGDALDGAAGGDAPGTLADGAPNDDAALPDDAAVKDDAFAPTDASQPVSSDGGTVCTPNLQLGQGCCPASGIQCIGAGCSYCLDCALCGAGYCCRVGKGNPGQPYHGVCKATVTCK